MTTKQAGALIKRGDYDNDKAIDYYEFLVRFGLEQQVPGKWEVQVQHITSFSILSSSYDSRCHSNSLGLWFFQEEKPVVQPVVEAAEVKTATLDVNRSITDATRCRLSFGGHCFQHPSGSEGAGSVLLLHAMLLTTKGFCVVMRQAAIINEFISCIS